MTPKEKAKELVEAFYDVSGDLNKPKRLTLWVGAKQSALIAVMEILDAISSLDGMEYWQQVKEEIIKL